MHQPHQHAFACAVRAQDDGARPGGNIQRDPVDDYLPAGREHDLLQLQRQDRRGAHPKRLCAASFTSCAAAFNASTIAIRMKPSPRASGRSPFEVSRAIAVVITRVTPSMLPPTLMTAPTSALARPRPAR